MGLYNQTIIESWEVWCYYRNTVHNSSTGNEYVVSEGRFSPDYTGIYKVGKNVSEISSTEELIESYVMAFKPDLKRICNASSATDASLVITILACVLNDEESSVSLTLKPWANSSGENWTSSTLISYDDIVNHFVPFDIDPGDYSSSSYETTISVLPSDFEANFQSIETMINSLIGENATGFFMTGENGYVETYGPDYIGTTVRPVLDISQVVSNRAKYLMALDAEISTISKVKGVCRDRDGNIVTGSQCEISVFSLSRIEEIGSGLSSSIDGSFDIDVDAKKNESVVVNFVNTTEDIDGSEIMYTTRSSSSSSSSSVSSSSSSESSSSSSSSLSESSSSYSSSSSSESSSSSSSSSNSSSSSSLSESSSSSSSSSG